jgi:hypothetical protein
MGMRHSDTRASVAALPAAAVLLGVLPAPAAHGASGETPGAKEAKARVKAVDAGAGRLALTVRGGKEMSFEVPETLRAQLKKVEAGQRVEIDYHEREGKNVAATIEEDD